MNSTRAAQVFGNVLEGAEEDGRKVATAGTGEVRTHQTRSPYRRGRRHRNAEGIIREDMDENGVTLTGAVLNTNTALTLSGSTPIGWTVSGFTNIRATAEGILADLPASTAGVIYQNVSIPKILRGRWIDLLARASGTGGRFRVNLQGYDTMSPSVQTPDSLYVTSYLDEQAGQLGFNYPVRASSQFVQVQFRVESGAALTDINLKQLIVYVGNFNALRPESVLTGAGGLLFGNLLLPGGGYFGEYAGKPSIFGPGSVGSREIQFFDRIYLSGRVAADLFRFNTVRAARRALNPGETDCVNGVLMMQNKDNQVTAGGLKILTGMAVTAANNTIAHGLGHAPTTVIVNQVGSTSDAAITCKRFQAHDATNLYLTFSGAGTVDILVG